MDLQVVGAFVLIISSGAINLSKYCSNITIARAQTFVAMQCLHRFLCIHSPLMNIQRNHTMLYLDDSRAVDVPGGGSCGVA